MFGDKIMKLYACLTAAMPTALVITLALVGCDEGSVALDANKADKVVLTDQTYPAGETVVTNVQLIAGLVEAMKCAKVDNTSYDMAMTLKIEFLAADTSLATISAGPPLFRLGKTQYYDRTGTFMEVIRTLTERSRSTNQVPEDRARKLADPQH